MSGGFEAMGLMPEVQRAVEEMGYTLPTDVQEEAIPLILGGGDVMVAAPTGSGKTAAFALPIIELVHEKLRERPAAKRKAPSLDFCISQEDRDASVAVGADGLVQTRAASWAGARAATGVLSRASYYFEVTMSDDGLSRVGWSLQSASLDLGTDGGGVGYGGTAKRSHARAFDDFGETYTKGDVVGVGVDFEKRKVLFSKNGRVFEGFDLPESMQGEALFPAVAMRNAEVQINFTNLKHVPCGFVALGDAPISDRFAPVLAQVDGAFGRSVSAIILEPARDLAEQTHSCFEAYCKYVEDPMLVCDLLIGGEDSRAVEARLKAGQVDILSATPVKLWSILKHAGLNVSSCRFFVLDEADRFIETDDVATVLQIFSKLPKHALSRERRLQVAFFSATLHSAQVQGLTDQLCDSATWVDLKGAGPTIPDAVHHFVIRVDPQSALVLAAAKQAPAVRTDAVHRKGDLNSRFTNLDDLATQARDSELVKLAKPALLLKLADALNMDQCLVFCRTNLDTDLLEKYLKDAGGAGHVNRYSCRVLGGMRSMNERRAALEAFKEGSVRFLICTDVAARGIDISGLAHVVNLTLPDVAANYIHRVGRVGRAGKMGLAISLVATVKERVWYCLNGKKPPQQDTRDADAGGNCVWYDEPALLAGVEAKLGGLPIREMDAETMALPAGLGGVAFGQSKDAPVDDSAAHADELIDDVQLLRSMETRAQRSFFAMQQLGKTAPESAPDDEEHRSKLARCTLQASS
ncbi:P-loop containing nucleoside triphosphate hydrolase protein [Pelagophyceae sp. CCMP2097]|nr:P-loop containing nucleoside triphosphate hydrolase protein [Pelagophyceae sp. CCMP2097]